MRKDPLQRVQHPLIREMLDSLPGYSAATEIAHRAEQRIRVLDGAVPAQQARPATADEVSDDWLDAEVQRRVTAQTVAAERAALVGLAEDCNADAATIARTAAGEQLLIELGARFDDVMAKVSAAVDELGEVTSAQEAITTGKTDAWQQLTALRDDYDSVRIAADIVFSSEHGDLVRRSRGLSADPEASSLRHRNLDAVAPGWRRGPANEYAADGTGSTPWPGDPVEQLVWFVRHGSEPWLPTAGQAESHLATRDQEARASRTDALVGEHQRLGRDPYDSGRGNRHVPPPKPHLLFGLG